MTMTYEQWVQKKSNNNTELVFANWKKENSGHLAPFYNLTLTTYWTQINQFVKTILLVTKVS